MPALDVTGCAGCSSDAAAVAVETAGALAVELRQRLDALRWGAWDGDCESAVLEDGLAGLDALRATVPALADVTYWAELQALDPELRVDRRALAGVRALEELVRRGRVLVPATPARV